MTARHLLRYGSTLRLGLGLAGALLLAACGDGGGTAPVTDAGTDAAADGGGRDGGGDSDTPPSDAGRDAETATGALHVRVLEVEAGAELTIEVSGPDGYSRTLTGADTLEGLVPGTYTVTAEDWVDIGASADTILQPEVDPTTVTVEAEATAEVTITYRPHPASGRLWIAVSSTGELRGYPDSDIQSDYAGTPDDAFGTVAGDDALAFDAGGNLWVANTFDHSLRMYAPATLSEGGPSADVTLSGSATGLDLPRGMAFDADGGLWVVNEGAETVARFAPSALEAGGDQAPEVTLDSSSFAAPSGLAFDGDGDLWVVMADTRTVVELGSSQLDASGTITPATAITLDVSSAQTQGLAFHLDGDLWVSDAANDALYRIPATDLSATATVAPDVTIDLGGGSPAGFAFDNAGDLWVPDTTSGEVLRFAAGDLTSSGSPSPETTIVGLGIGDLNRPVPAFYPPSPALPLPRPAE